MVLEIISIILFIVFVSMLLGLIAGFINDVLNRLSKNKVGENAAKAQPLPLTPNTVEAKPLPLQIDTNTQQPSKAGQKNNAVLHRLLLLIIIAVGFFYLQSLINSIPRQIHNLEKGNSSTRHSAIHTLSELGATAVEPLIDAFHDSKSEYLQSGAVEALIQIRDKKAVEPLIAVLKDEAPIIRAAAAEALGLIEDKRALEPLIAVLKDENPTVREAAVKALGLFEDKSVIEPLLAILNDEAPTVQTVAIKALWRKDDERIIERLIALLNDEDQSVRVEAAHALVKNGDDRSVEPLKAALMRKDYAVIAEESAFFIKQAKTGDEPVFIFALNAYGTVATANNYLNCGNTMLAEAAVLWAKTHGYEINPSYRSDGVYWGSGQ